MSAHGDQVRTTKCPGGPLLVRGAEAWEDKDGEVHPVTRPVVAVCRCRRSELLPWCDGSHKLPKGG
ncbi:CDGSH iron-sulfur domain-containing protein [Nocardioides gilvus]|uniref:CDGSH iron-sulfur domain-containing protein n=1 Tax=Nocardioides gilvus TaxID=1735589 RepID=UPI001EF74F1A|nr:CDGSH iron-sulfur domain-containing protein [Nocardioides gilvus]